MSKNAITVIDQELIDYFESALSLNDYDNKVRELFIMAKDLIEINAELIKREQKYKGALEWVARVNAMDYQYKAVAEEALKGDSDE